VRCGLENFSGDAVAVAMADNSDSPDNMIVLWGVSKLKLKEMGSRYLFIVLSIWLEKHLSRGDYKRKQNKNQVV